MQTTPKHERRQLQSAMSRPNSTIARKDTVPVQSARLLPLLPFPQKDGLESSTLLAWVLCGRVEHAYTTGAVVLVLVLVRLRLDAAFGQICALSDSSEVLWDCYWRAWDWVCGLSGLSVQHKVSEEVGVWVSYIRFTRSDDAARGAQTCGGSFLGVDLRARTEQARSRRQISHMNASLESNRSIRNAWRPDAQSLTMTMYD